MAEKEEFDAQGKTEELNQVEEPQANQPQPENEPQPIGALFGNITYYNQQDVPNFFERMTGNDAIFILLSAARYSQAKGVYSLEESEAISRAIRIITTPPAEPTGQPE